MTYRFIHAEKATWSIRLMCRVLEVARAAYYEWTRGEVSARKAEDARLLVHIRTIHRRSRGTYGSPRVHADLLAEGHEVGRHRVARLMSEHGLSGTPKKKFRGTTTDSEHDHAIADNLLQRDFTATQPNQVWVGDITYLPTAAGWVYLSVLLDLYSRKVVGWALEPHMRTSLCTTALSQAEATRAPTAGLIHHSDRGSQYASDDYRAALTTMGAVPSMSRKGNCWDNAVAESFFGTLEQELVGQLERPWLDAVDARRAVGDYVHAFYNPIRRHSTVGQVSPVEFEAAARASTREAA